MRETDLQDALSDEDVPRSNDRPHEYAHEERECGPRCDCQEASDEMDTDGLEKP
jgi:hypothetical protein